LPVEFKATFPEKCFNFYLEAGLGHSMNNLRALCQLERAQARVPQSMQGCLDFQGKQKINIKPITVCAWLVSIQTPTHSYPVPCKITES